MYILFSFLETVYAVVKAVAKKNKYNLMYDPILNMNFDICWTDCHVKQEIFLKMQQHQKINHFPGMGILSRKNNLGKSLMSFRYKFSR
jgi:tubulin polyglutamylase TTLL6/13